MIEKRLLNRTGFTSFSNLFERRKDFILASFFSALMLLCIAPLQPAENLNLVEIEISETSGRDSVYEGDWAAYKQLPYNDGYCDSEMAYDNKNDYLAMTYCPDYASLEVLIYHNSDWNTLVSTIESDLEGFDFMKFSPNGGYLILIRYQYFEVYQTSDWQYVFSGDISSDDGNYYRAYDITWSGDDQRLVISTGSNGGKMYEGPDWDEVDGTNSNGLFVAHHPSEDILWYLSYDGAGSEYEYENIPFVGYQWVLKQNFNVDSELAGRMTASPGGDFLLLYDMNYVSAFSSSDYSQLFSRGGENPAFSSDGNHVIFTIDYYGGSGYKIYSTESWLMTSENDDSTVFQSAFSSDDSEIITSGYAGAKGSVLTGWMPDYDSDGVVNQQDLCPETPEEEESDLKGCAPSQKDTDFDGVNDRDDVCPRTSTSDSANDVGCSESQLLDTDGDGVSDSDDLCPNTPSTEFGNIYGCSKSQRDVDGDGQVDSLDNCPLYDVEACPNVLSWVISTEPVVGTENLRRPQWSPKGDLVSAYDTDSDNIFILGETLLFMKEISLQNESQQIISSSWGPEGEWLLIFWESSSWRDSKCGYYIWNVESESLSQSYEIGDDCDYISGYAISPDGTQLAISYYSYESYSGKMKMFEITSHLLKFEDEDHHARKLIFSHDGTTLIGSTSSEVFLWDVYDGYLLQSRSIGSFDSMILSPDGDFIFTWNDETIKVYSLNTLELKSTTTVEGKTNDNYIYISLAFSRSSELLYVSFTERQPSGSCWYCNYNSSTQTYQVLMGQNLEFITSTELLVNSTYAYPSATAPDEKSILVSMNRYGGEIGSGLYLWMSDSDGDNITDASDLCQNTNLNDSSDETGCSWGQKDDDGDDVFNKEDLCPDTRYGKAIDEYGCSDQQVDQDLDGICDDSAQSDGPSNCVGTDTCPNTLPGMAADITGCSWEQQDDDFDSIQNSIDICPETSPGEVANLVGCGEQQRDSDEDNLNDFWDICPLTEVNSTIDDTGCSDLQVDTDSDSVCNPDALSSGPSNCTGVDRCPRTNSNHTIDEDGCSWDQRDDDGDGIYNQYDSCPDTLVLEVSPNGCSNWQRDTDNDGISDAIDECAKTPDDEFSNQVGCSESQVQPNMKSEAVDESSATQWVVIGSIVLIVFLLSAFLLRRGKSLATLNQPETGPPQYSERGAMRADGKEWIESPAESGNWFYRDAATGQWAKKE